MAADVVFPARDDLTRVSKSKAPGPSSSDLRTVLQPQELPEPNTYIAGPPLSQTNDWIGEPAQPYQTPSTYLEDSYFYPLQADPSKYSKPRTLPSVTLPYVTSTFAPGPAPYPGRHTSDSAHSSQSPPPTHATYPDFNAQTSDYLPPVPANDIITPQENYVAPETYHVLDQASTYPQARHDHPHTTQYSEISRRTNGSHQTAWISDADDTSIAREPSLRFSQETWWDAVLDIYDGNSRERAISAVNSDVMVFFRYSSTWMSCINLQLFFNMFHHPEYRGWMQPSLVLSLLAYSAFIQGSEIEGGEAQRRKGSQLRQVAQSAFDASYNAGWLDVQLAQASWVCDTLPFPGCGIDHV